MKKLTTCTLLLLATLCACQKASDKPSGDLFSGKNLEGKWTPVKSTVVLKYDDGTVQNVSVTGEPGEFLEFKLTKTSGHNSEGTFSQSAVNGTLSSGKWTLAQDKAELDLIHLASSGNIFQYRRIDELDEHTLVMSADDKMVLLFVEVNDLNENSPKKIVGGSVFEEFKR
jgi:hypothetical protein